ncbi:hypothetical protein BZB76_3282 [Actinomadura pelletieri DSM 43383]|uniref:Uncharacterized protein n=1 Tax=Actinomadura pelletieri DSM 43383 TaxID=1120940 RepID=A0A495QP55_9ACTN|nr:hypothetical protein [Actinomadura pelletieri]RKS74763.1 hypothetical protein BZB76_3282 [Actinomadura pelletieri DSM 43383]
MHEQDSHEKGGHEQDGHEQDRCEGPQRGCAQLPTLEIILGRLADRSLLEPLRVCSQCGACLLTVHGVWPEGAPSPFRVVRLGVLQRRVPAHGTARYPSRPRRAVEAARPA